MAEGPMSFLHLDLLIEILTRASEELASDFETKSQFCKEQERKCIENAKNLLSVDQAVKSLNVCMLMLEMEQHENETNLIKAENAISRLERTCQSDCEDPPSRVYPLSRATYMDLLEQLMETEKTYVQCNDIKAEIEEFRKEALKNLVPRNVITRIISYHTATLESMEKQIKHFESHIKQVQVEFDRLLKYEEAQKSTVKCPCELTATDEPMDTS